MPKPKRIPRERIMASKGYTDHDPAGSKLRRLAYEKRIAVAHRGNLRVVGGRINRII